VLESGLRAPRSSPTATTHVSMASSLGVVASAIVVALGAPIGDPIIGLLITLVILKITWDSWRTVRTSEPGEPLLDQSPA
jgi:divalent metal cation (Fe/Co/Zn/Cd) transporter